MNDNGTNIGTDPVTRYYTVTAQITRKHVTWVEIVLTCATARYSETANECRSALIYLTYDRQYVFTYINIVPYIPVLYTAYKHMGIYMQYKYFCI